MVRNTNSTFLLLGEAVVDLISTEIVPSLKNANSFRKFAGGEVSNLAMNLSRLGFSAALGACVGNDGFGNFLHDQIAQAGVNLDLLQTTMEAPTTIIPVTQHTGTPDFSIYRGADRHLTLTDQLLTAVDTCKAIHTSAFALSQDPCRSTILQILRIVREKGLLLSFDPNFHPSIWSDLQDHQAFLRDIFRQFTVTKPSLDDSTRIMGPGLEPVEYLERFLDLGPEIVALTMGNQGVLLGTSSGERVHIHANSVPVVDVTGAGDAFWSGLLIGLLEGKTALESAKIGQAIAEYKIGILGPVQKFPPIRMLNGYAKEITVKILPSR